MDAPSTGYLEYDEANIVWQVFGEGSAEIMIVPGWASNVDSSGLRHDVDEVVVEDVIDQVIAASGVNLAWG